MTAEKILKTHMKADTDDHLISEIVETLTSNLYFHGHPINRREARNDLQLKVNLDVPPELETALWDLYLEYDAEFKNSEPYNPSMDLAGGSLRSAQEESSRDETAKKTIASPLMWIRFAAGVSFSSVMDRPSFSVIATQQISQNAKSTRPRAYRLVKSTTSKS